MDHWPKKDHYIYGYGANVPTMIGKENNGMEIIYSPAKYQIINENTLSISLHIGNPDEEEK